jgi:lysophospholipase L1-like esterase
MSLVDIALANDIQVALASIPPAAEFNWRPEIDPVPIIQKMNDWLRAYAKEKQLRYIDYHSALAGASGELKSELGNDGVHPNRRGYEIMREVMKAHGIEPR